MGALSLAKVVCERVILDKSSCNRASLCKEIWKNVVQSHGKSTSAFFRENKDFMSNSHFGNRNCLKPKFREHFITYVNTSTHLPICSFAQL